MNIIAMLENFTSDFNKKIVYAQNYDAKMLFFKKRIFA